METYVLYVADTETTGLIADKHEIVELSLKRAFLDSEKETEQKTWLIRATLPDNIEDEALAVSGHKREDILGLSKFGRENYLLPKDVLPQVENWMSDDNMTIADRVLVGHHAPFDYSMLHSMWKRHAAEDTFPFQTGPNKLIIDTKEIALFIDILIGRKRKQYNLTSIVKDYGIKKEKAHRADADVRMTYEILMKQISPFRDIAKSIFGESTIDENII